MKTQHQKILAIMQTDPKKWWLPQDFMQPSLGENFVGYESSARLSELAKLDPPIIESRRDGKYIARRLITGKTVSTATAGHYTTGTNSARITEDAYVSLEMPGRFKGRRY